MNKDEAGNDKKGSENKAPNIRENDTGHTKEGTNTTESKGKITTQLYNLDIDKKIEICIAAILVIVTGCYTWYARRQWEAVRNQAVIMKQQIKDINEQFALENRAWITVDGVDRGEFQVGEKTKIVVAFINSGNTPAINMGGISHSGFLKIENFAPVCVDSDAITNIAVLGPGDKNAFTGYTKKQLSKDDIDSLNNRSLRYYVWGYIYYDDIFGRKHLTEYCFVSRPDIKDFNSCDCCNSID